MKDPWRTLSGTRLELLQACRPAVASYLLVREFGQLENGPAGRRADIQDRTDPGSELGCNIPMPFRIPSGPPTVARVCRVYRPCAYGPQAPRSGAEEIR